MLFIRESPIRMDDWGVPLFLETSDRFDLVSRYNCFFRVRFQSWMIPLYDPFMFGIVQQLATEDAAQFIVNDRRISSETCGSDDPM